MKKIEFIEQGKVSNSHLMVFIIILLWFIGGCGIDVFTPSLPAMAVYFHASYTSVKMTIPSFLAGWAISSLIFGTLSDSIGRRNLTIYFLLIFALINFFSIFSTSIEMLIILRFFSGFAMGGPNTVGRALLPECFTGKFRAKATAYAAMFFALSITISPALGGYLQYYLGWSGSFLFMVLIPTEN